MQRSEESLLQGETESKVTMEMEARNRWTNFPLPSVDFSHFKARDHVLILRATLQESGHEMRT
jgi:hypothetical protein